MNRLTNIIGTLKQSAIVINMAAGLLLLLSTPGVMAQSIPVDSVRPTAALGTLPGSSPEKPRQTESTGSIKNEVGAAWDFKIAPAWCQTSWFLALCVATAMAGLYFLYVLWLKHVGRRVTLQMQACAEERERIARDLHDTLLQSVQGLILKFDAVAKQIPSDESARQALEKTLDLADQVLAEGRDCVRNLRESVSIKNLPMAFRQVAESTQEEQAAFKAVIEGNVRELNLMVLDEVYAIGREGLINALTHSGCLNVEVEIIYDSRQFRLRVRDDGRGIDPGTLDKGGRPDHWGLQGMRERAHRIGAQLRIWSRTGTGTEIELTVPAATAYRTVRVKSARFGFGPILWPGLVR